MGSLAPSRLIILIGDFDGPFTGSLLAGLGFSPHVFGKIFV